MCRITLLSGWHWAQLNYSCPLFLGAAYEAANDPTYCIDLNEATAEQLAELPNVGPVRAEHIIEMRPWTNADELSQVSGLGVASVETIKNSGLVCP
ncbi:hypothetical protein HAALTHF_05230n [Vreelandella aquamarina]|nr:hypothetical protein HAALTHF_05230n [Halomonas axialensis]